MLLRLRKIERQPSSREGKDRHRRLKNRDRLQRMRITHSERMAVETEEQRGQAAERMRANQLAAETEEQREARLQRMRANQSERLAAETEQQREARLQRDKEGQQQPQLP